MQTRPLYVYGSLMFPKILLGIIGRIPLMQPAVLRGYNRMKMKNDLYPSVVSSQSNKNSVAGFLLYGLTETEIAQLDDFEGDFFQRELVNCKIHRGEEKSWTYVIKPKYQSLLSNLQWDPSRMRAEIEKVFFLEAS